MPADRVLVIDAGTSALRAVAVDASGAATTIASEPWPAFIPDDAAPFGREFDAPAVAALVRRLVETNAGTGVRAIAFTGQREGLAFLDRHGEALLASPNIDARASAEGMAIDAAYGEQVHAITGHLPSLMQAPAKLAWLRTHRPDLAARVARALPLADWLASVVAGDCGMSSSLAAENGLLDVSTGGICADLLARAEFAPSLAPVPRSEICAAGSLAGVPIVLAGADTQCALVGVGAVSDGDTAVPAGWSAPLQMVTDAPVLDPQMRTWTSVHVIPGRWILESNAGETGRAWEWACAMLGYTPADGSALAASAPRGSGDVMTVLGSRAMNAAAMNAGIGALTLPLPLAMSAPDRPHVLRSVLESIAYAIRANLEQLEHVSARRIDRLRLGGGMSRDALFAQIVADVIDRRVEVAPSPETTAVGAAALAFVAIQRCGSAGDAVEAMCGGGRVVEPDVRASSEYEDYYARWCAMAREMERLSSL